MRQASAVMDAPRGLLDLFGPLLVLAAQAGEAIMAVHRRMYPSGGGAGTGQVDHKADGSPLTEADLGAHRIIAAGLPGVLLAGQSWPVVSEEDLGGRDAAVAAGRFWLVDPLDGTREFIGGNTDFTVNIALVHDGAPVLGVVLAPALDEAWWGGRGLGAWHRRGAGAAVPIRTSGPRAAGRPARVLASRSHMDERTRQWIDALGPCELVQAGSSLKFCRIAEGCADLYPRFGPTAEWDTAAAHAVVEGAGGRVTQPDGTALRYGKPDPLNPPFVVTG